MGCKFLSYYFIPQFSKVFPIILLDVRSTYYSNAIMLNYLHSTLLISYVAAVIGPEGTCAHA